MSIVKGVGIFTIFPNVKEEICGLSENVIFTLNEKRL